ncbi:MAG: tetratricopeptide repeat protein [Verrucomicrobiota bacterium]
MMKFFVFLLLLTAWECSSLFAIPMPDVSAEIHSSALDKLETARWLYHRKEYVMAENILKDIFSQKEMHPSIHSKALLLLANINKETGRSPEALVYLQLWRTRFPGAPEIPRVNLLMGRVYRDMKAYDRAREFFYLTLSSLVVVSSRKERDPVTLQKDKRLSQVATWEIAETEYQAGNWQNAHSLFERFKQQNSDVEDLIQASLYRQADCLYQLGKFDKALNTYQTAISVGPFHPFAPEAWLRLIDIYGRQNDYIQQKQAIEAFIWVVKEMYPQETDYWQQRCASVLVQFTKDHPDEAKALLTVLQNGQPNARWNTLEEFLQKLTARTRTESPPAKIEGDENWIQWHKKVSQDNVKLNQSINALDE